MYCFFLHLSHHQLNPAPDFLLLADKWLCQRTLWQKQLWWMQFLCVGECCLEHRVFIKINGKMCIFDRYQNAPLNESNHNFLFQRSRVNFTSMRPYWKLAIETLMSKIVSSYGQEQIIGLYYFVQWRMVYYSVFKSRVNLQTIHHQYWNCML